MRCVVLLHCRLTDALYRYDEHQSHYERERTTESHLPLPLVTDLPILAGTTQLGK
jgi:hypothetical protein